MRTESGSLSHDPYWWDAAPRESPIEAELPKSCDVVIIGAGYAGLSAALTLARAGRSVVVLDALAPGEGASSRSGGMIGHGHRLSYTKLIERFGPQKAGDLIREGMASLEFAKALIVDETIDAQLQVSGRVRGAWTKGDYAALTRDAQALQRDLGMAVDVLSKADVRREIAADCYQGGLLFHAHGGVHPALFHLGLLRRARTAGAFVAGPISGAAFNPAVGVSAAVCAWLAASAPFTYSRTVAPSNVAARCVHVFSPSPVGPRVIRAPGGHAPPTAGRLPWSDDAIR